MQAKSCYAGERELRAAIAAADEFLLSGGDTVLLSTVAAGLREARVLSHAVRCCSQDRLRPG